MIVKVGESKQEVLRSGTYDSVSVIANCIAAADNNRLTASDMDMSNINVKVLLKRGRNTEILMNDNLKLLGTFNTILGGVDEFFNGVDIEAPGASTKHRQLRPVTLKFGSHVRVNAGDEIVCEIKVANSGAFGTDIDASDSFIEYYFNSSQGY